MATATATKASKATDGLDERREAQERLDEARQERARLGEESRAYATELARADAALRHLARTSRDQVDGGQPKPGSEAAKLKAKLDQAEESKWPDILAGADQRIAELEDEVRRLTDRYAVELATPEFRTGEEELTKLDELADQLLAILSSLEARSHRLINIAASCQGRIDGRDVYTDDRLAQLRDLLIERASFRPPRIPILTPFTDEQPRVVRGKSGGWIDSMHGSDNNADEQPPKLKPRR
jgi:hypothetical protein